MAEEWHLSAELVRRFLDQRVSKNERKAVVRHLISQCPDCLSLASRISTESGFWYGRKTTFADQDYNRAFEAAFKFGDGESRRIAGERLRGWGHWSTLARLLPNERLPFIMEHPEYRHWGLFRALLDAAVYYSFRDPQEAVD